MMAGSNIFFMNFVESSLILNIYYTIVNELSRTTTRELIVVTFITHDDIDSDVLSSLKEYDLLNYLGLNLSLHCYFPISCQYILSYLS